MNCPNFECTCPRSSVTLNLFFYKQIAFDFVPKRSSERNVGSDIFQYLILLFLTTVKIYGIKNITHQFL